MANIDPIGKPDKKKRKKGEPKTREGEARRRRAQAEIEAGRQAALGGAAGSFGPAKKQPRPAPEELEEVPEGEREEERRERPRREKEEQKPEEEKAEETGEKPEEGEAKPEEKEAEAEGGEPKEEAEGEPGEAPAETAPEGAEAGGEAGPPAEPTEAAPAKAGGAGVVRSGAVEGGEVAGKAAGGAASKAVVAEGAATAPLWLEILAVVLIVIAIILLILAIIFIISQLGGAGRSPKQEPSPNSQADMIDRGKAIANAGGGVNSLVQARGMAGNESFNQSKDEISQIANQAPAGIDKNKLNDLSQNLNLNLEVLQSGAGDDVYVANESDKIKDYTNQIKDLSNNCTEENCQKLNNDADKISSIMDELKQYSFTKNSTSMDGKATTTKIPSGIEINPLDLQYIKDNKVDIRILRLINHLGEAGWDRLKISRIVDFDPNDDESRVASEDEATVSAHNSGQAIDISIVGTFTCSKRDWSLGGMVTLTRATEVKVTHYPCYVYYQSGAKPNMLTSYGNPRGDSFNEIFTNFSFDQASMLLNNGNFDGSNFSDFLVQAGMNALIGQTGMTPAIYEFPTTDSGLGAYALGESLELNPTTFIRMAQAQNDDSAWATFGAGVLAQSMKMPSGSFEGSNTDEILRSIANAYVRQSLGIERTSPSTDLSALGIGSALLEKILFTRDPQTTKERLQLSENILNKSLNLPSGVTSNYLSGNTDYGQLATAVGNNQIQELNTAYQGAGLERALGIPTGSWPGITTNNGDTQKRVGAAILARNTSMNEGSAYQNPDDLVNNLDKQAVINLTVIKQSDFANLVKGEDSTNKLKTVADNFVKNKSNQNLNFAVRQGLNKNNIDAAKLTGNKFKAIFSPQTLNGLLSATSNSLLERSIYSYQANFGDYTMTTSDIERVRRGDISSVVYKLAGGIFDRELNLPIGFTQALVENRSAPRDLMAQAGISLLAQALGINISGVVLNQSWYEPGVIPKRLAQRKIESNGLRENSFNGNIDNVIAANGIKLVVASLGLSEEEYALVRAGQANDYIKSKLYGIDAAQGVPNGTSMSFATGSISADQVVSSLAASLTQTIQTGGIQGLATILGLDGQHLPTGDLLAAFLGNDSTTTVNFFSSLADSSINQDLSTSNNFFTALVSTNDASLQSIVANEGINIFSQLFGSSQSGQIAALFAGSYLQGGSAAVPNLLKNDTGITNTQDASTLLLGQAKSALAYWGMGQLTGAVNQTFGNVGITYDQARVMFAGNPAAGQTAYQATVARGGSTDEATQAYQEATNQARSEAGKSIGYAYLDLGLNRLDPSLPYGTARILTEGTNEQRAQFALAYAESKITINGQPLAPGTLIGVANFINSGDFEDLGPATLASVDSALNLPQGTTQTIQGFVQNNGEFGFDVSNIEGWAAGSLDGWVREQTGFDLGSVINIQQSIVSGQIMMAGDPETIITNLLINWAIGEFGSKIDSALGLPGFTSAAIACAIPPHIGCVQLAMVFLNKIFGIGTTCQDPVAITRQHIRTLLGQALNAPDTPSQIATYRQEDVNYYSGLKDNGEVDMRLRNILYEKYGPTSMRVYRGMFDLPSAFDHIHIGY